MTETVKTPPPHAPHKPQKWIYVPLCPRALGAQFEAPGFKTPAAPAVKREDWGSLIKTGAIGCMAFKAPPHSRSGSSSPAFASSKIFWAIAARVGLAVPSGALERHKSHFVCEAHDPECLGVEPLAIEVKSDRHMHLPLQAGALPNSQPPMPGYGLGLHRGRWRRQCASR